MKRNKSIGTLIIGLCLLFIACQSNNQAQKAEVLAANGELLHQWNEQLEAAIVSDFFSPPVASRIYVYSNMAAYETLANNNAQYQSLAEFIPEFPSIKPASSDKVVIEIAAMMAFYEVGKQLVYAAQVLDDYQPIFRQKLKAAGFTETDIEQASIYGKAVAQQIMMWAKKDGYDQSRTYPEHSLIDTLGAWIPTPPDYFPALEPHWHKLRTYVMDSAAQFHPKIQPTTYDTSHNAPYFKELMEVYDAVKKMDKEKEHIAKFWDCNPNVPIHQGHVVYNEKKLTPGGHWININRIAARKKQLNLMQTAEAYTMVTIGIADAFISCWYTKYQTNYIRPVSTINKHIDPDWQPLLYTPNFPEYTSGHSVVSGSASTILTQLYGHNFAFVDSTEVPYGVAPRSFPSFAAAAEEAAISRLHGGIHYMPAIVEGKKQGKAVGKLLAERLKLRR